MATPEEIVTHIERLGLVVRSAHLKRALTRLEKSPTLNFWRLIYGNLLDVAVLEWCKVFGSNTEPTHWKRIVADEEHFRIELLKFLRIEETRWTEYWHHMKDYRDSRIAHHWDLETLDSYPDLTLALESSYFYYDYLIKELRRQGETNFPDDLREYCERYTAQALEIGRAALAATASFSERVD